MDFNYIGLDDFLLASLREDVGAGDITTNSCVPEAAVSTGTFIAKAPGVICGLGVITRLFALLDGAVCITPIVIDGAPVERGDVIASITGPSRSILTGERTALNILQHMSGVATGAAAAVAAVKGAYPGNECASAAINAGEAIGKNAINSESSTSEGAVTSVGAKIVDTRKTIPGLRALDKYAVRCGGGANHRFNLSDGVLIKDNHIIAAGGITEAVRLARSGSPHTLKIEIETETIAQVEEALSAGADIIMLDNMTTQMMADAVRLIGGRALTEASGNMGERDLKEVAGTGVDFISIGALTHSVKALDISLKFS